MRDWKLRLTVLASLDNKTTPFPLTVFDAAPPSQLDWPQSLPRDEQLVEFYRTCNGAYLGAHLRFFDLESIESETARWVTTLRGWDDTGDVLDPLRHVVVALDAGGCPVVLDTATGLVAAFQFDGGSWEPPLASSFEEFVSQIFNSPEEDDDLWSEALKQLDQVVSARGLT